jgi:hypothetical protein
VLEKYLLIDILIRGGAHEHLRSRGASLVVLICYIRRREDSLYVFNAFRVFLGLFMLPFSWFLGFLSSPFGTLSLPLITGLPP